jgi:hypothetical protein
MMVLAAVTGKVPFPAPVVEAMRKVLAAQLPLDPGKLDGPTLAKAISASGLFQEAKLGQGQVPSGLDQKTALLALRQSLASWLAPQASAQPIAQTLPPMRGQVPRARPSEIAPVDTEAHAEELGKQIFERTEESLSRLRLHQNASMPDPVARDAADWSMDLPVLVGTQQSVLHLQIRRYGESSGVAPGERGWQMRFAISLPQLGEVGAQVSLRGGATGVMLWATERETSGSLETHLPALRQTLAEIGLRPGSILVRHGEPPASPPTGSGHFLDART